MKKLLFIFLLCSAPAHAYFGQIVSVCNNSPIGNGMKCYASNSGSANSINVPIPVNFSSFPSSSTIIVAAAELNNDLWAPSRVYSPGTSIIDANGNIQDCTTGGTSGASTPTWHTSGTTTDNTVIWTFNRLGRFDPAWLPGDISDTLHSTWTFISNYASGVEDGNVVQFGVWYTTYAASTTTADTINMTNPDTTGGTSYGMIYTGFGAVDSTQGFVANWGGPTLGDVQTGNYAVTPGDTNLAFMYSDFPYPKCNTWTSRVNDQAAPRGFEQDQLAISTTANATAAITNSVDGYFGIGYAWKPASLTSVSFTPFPYPPIQQGVVYASTPIFTITGGTAPYTCSTFSGSVPSGLSVTTSGNKCMLSGTPTVNGDFTWTEEVTDNNGGTFTGNPYLVISTPTLPTFSSINVVPFFSSATVTWTSNVPTTTQVCFTTATTLGYICPFPTDLAGVTSHSITIFNINTGNPFLTAGTTYTYYLFQQGLVSTVPSDYVQNVSSTFTFTTLPAQSAGTTSYTMYTNGPFDVILGSTITIPIYLSVNTGRTSFTSLTINVILATAGVPDGFLTNAQVYWPNQQALGMNGTVSSVFNTNSTLTFNSVGDVLNLTPFQVGTNIGGTTIPGSYLVEVASLLQPGNVFYAFETAVNVYPTNQAPHMCIQNSPSGGGGGGGSTPSNCTMSGGFTFKGSFQ